MSDIENAGALPIVRSLWIGSGLSSIEKLALESFMRNGHSVELFVYNKIEGVPDGVRIMDANEIIEERDIFLGQANDNKLTRYEAFSDMFRYAMLYKLGGIWADLDMICIQPIDFQDEYFFASHKKDKKDPEAIPSGCIMKLPAGSELALHCLSECGKIEDKNKILYCDIGPRLIANAIPVFGLGEYVKKPETFCPIEWWQIERLVEPNRDFEVYRETYGIHCFTAVWNQRGFDKNGAHHRYSVIEQLKRFYSR